MDISYILEFIVLADTVNFGTAAKQLGITQSTLSKHVRQLEEDLGAPLFNRTKRNVSLNEFGELFLSYAQRIAAVYNHYSDEMQEQNSLASRTLRIGVFPMMMYYNIMDLIQAFLNQNPEISIEYVEGETEQLKAMLLQHRLDFAFLRELSADQSPEYIRETFAKDVLVALLPSNHPLAKAEHVTIEQLASESFLLVPKGSTIHSLCLNLFADAGITPNIVYIGSGENIFDLVPSGSGISLLTKRPAAFLANPNTSIVDISPTVTTDINLIYQKTRQVSPALKKFLDFYHKHAV